MPENPRDEQTYDSFSVPAGIHLLQTSPWLGNGYDLNKAISVTLLPSGGFRVGYADLTPDQIMTGQDGGYLKRHTSLRGTFVVTKDPGWDVEVDAAQHYKANAAKMPLSEFMTEGVPTALYPQDIDFIFETITSWRDMLYPDGKANSAGSSTSIAGSGSAKQAIQGPGQDPQALVSTTIGNPWATESNFTSSPPGPFIIDESKMYRREFYNDGKEILNGEVVVEGSYTGPAQSLSVTMDVEGAKYTGTFKLVEEDEA